MDKEYKILCNTQKDVLRNVDFLKSAIAQDTGQQYVESLCQLLETKWASYVAEWDKFAKKYGDKDGFAEKEENHITLTVNYHDSHINASLYLRSQTQTPKIPPSSPKAPQPFKVKLPVINLKEFHGDPLDWTRFWNQFSSMVDERTDLDDTTKYTYLTQCIKGPAETILDGFRGKAVEYKDALKALQNMYGDEDKLTRILIRSFLDLPKPKYIKSEVFQFKVKLDNFLIQMEHNPEINVSQSTRLISEIIILKFPKEVEDFLFHLYNTTYFTLDQITKGLQKLLDYMDENKSTSPLQKQLPKVKPVDSQLQVISNQQSSNNSGTSVGVYSTMRVFPCIYCKQNHKSHDCLNYATLPVRRDRLKALNRCTRCAKAHNVSECQTVLTLCPRCRRGKHHSFLCVSNTDTSNQSSKPVVTVATNVNTQPSQRDVMNHSKPPRVTKKSDDSSRLQGDPIATSQVMSVLSNRISEVNYRVSLATATVGVHSDTGQRTKVRCLFDCGSQRSFIHKDLANQLQLKNVASLDMVFDSFNSKGDSKVYEIVRPVISLGKRKKRVTLAVVDSMPQQFLTPGLYSTVTNLSAMGYEMADKEITSDVVDNIQILIGSDYFGRYMSGMTTINNTDLFESPGGYLVYGIIPHMNSDESSSSMNALVSLVINQSMGSSQYLVEPRNISSSVIEDTLPVSKLWDLDAVGINPLQAAPSDITAYSHFQSTVQYEDNRYWVELPFKVNSPHLPNNYKLALAQMHNQRRRFLGQPELLSCYNGIINEQLKLGYIEEVDDPVVGPNTHYLPHHAVCKQSSTTPLRIVYNCSAKMSKTSPSLNDCLITGPSLTEKLTDVLIKFRSKQFACVADIQKAFLQVGLQTHHRDFTRFLWPSDPFKEDSLIRTFRFRAVLFGATCSPFLLQMTLQHHLNQSSSIYANALLTSFYVDNLQLTLDKEEELLDIYDVANNELQNAGMRLQEWNSNSEMLKAYIQDNSSVPITFPEISNILGLDWNTVQDTLTVKSRQFGDLEYVTKRQLLSLVSTCFDPLGMYAPVLIKGKLLIQSAWKEKVGWDVLLPPQYLKKWNSLASEIEELPSIKFPRCVCVTNEQYSLHAFVDASTVAYGVVCYLTNQHTSHFVACKARVAPLKSRTLPQLELTALQIGTQFASYLQSLLKEFVHEVIILCMK